MNKTLRRAFAMLVVLAAATAARPAAARDTVGKGWRKHDINPTVPYEGVGVLDVDGDGRLDVFSGESWYRAPRRLGAPWTQVRVREVKPSAQNPRYHEDFANLPYDVDGDGDLDLITCTYFGQYLGWIERPDDPAQPWREHEMDRPGPSEACRLVDLDGDGRLDVLPATNNVVVWYDLVAQRPAPRWDKHVVDPRGPGHGLGVGDVNGDGRLDLLVPRGWYEQPRDPRKDPWIFRAEWNLGGIGILAIARDFDGDGLADVVWGMGHDYGLYWLRQGKSADGARTWTREPIDTAIAQLHTMLEVPLDGPNARPVLVTGTRVYGHEIEPGCTDPPGIYAFRYDRKARAWKKQVIYRGRPAVNPPADAAQRRALDDFPRGTAGTGLHVEAVDIDGDGDIDLVCPGKSGLYLFENLTKRPRR